MIELRWVTFGPNRQLEYRTLKWRVDAGGALNVLPAPIEWTDWKRVPSVDGDEAAYQDIVASGGIMGSPDAARE